MLAGTEFERMLAVNIGSSEQAWDPFPSPSKPKPTTTCKRNRTGDDTTTVTVERQPADTRKRKNQSTPAAPSLGRLKMQALLQREQEILKAKDESPYPTPVEETSHSLLLKSFQKQQLCVPPTPAGCSLSSPSSSSSSSLLLAAHPALPPLPPLTRPFAGSAAFELLHARSDGQLHQHDPMILNYFYMYLDLMEGRDGCELDRHPLALLTKLDSTTCGAIDVAAVCHDRFPKLAEMCDRGISSREFMLVKLNLDLNLLQPGDFHNISVLETTRPRTVECTTTVYHFGQRILETKEIQYPAAPTAERTEQHDDHHDDHALDAAQPHTYATRSRRRGSCGVNLTQLDAATRKQREAQRADLRKRSLYHFDFVQRFFSTFLAGLHCFDMEVEKRIAVDNLSVIQVFEDISAPFDTPHAMNPPLLCICYQFECGKGDAKGFFINPAAAAAAPLPPAAN
ncbi:hypothetical protein DFJ77DRAFT_436441 [Powellomyces hirtus]|nr:hypothetical protein DFJ77DRAFT_436441 [Powellomyces hirtus]